MTLTDPELVRREYASERRLLARRVVFADLVEGPSAEELAFEAVREAGPARVLEVGCGPGSFSERLRRELGTAVVALDISPRMVELARRRGVEAHVGDVEELPFPAGEFGCVVANWMLYHVHALDRALAEIARVLGSGGRLVAATFGEAQLRDLWAWLGFEKTAAVGFNRENGAEKLARHFARVERRDADGVVVFPDAGAVRRYVRSTIRGAHLADAVPDFAGEFRARSVQCVFVAERPA